MPQWYTYPIVCSDSSGLQWIADLVTPVVPVIGRTSSLKLQWFVVAVVFSSNGLMPQWFEAALLFSSSGLQLQWFIALVILVTPVVCSGLNLRLHQVTAKYLRTKL